MIVDELVLNFILLFLLLEIYEVQWQKAETLLGMLARMYAYYHRSVFLFLIAHPTFYFAIGFMTLSDYNIYAVTLFLIKAVDIAVKIVLLKEVFLKKELSPELTLALLTPINKFIPYMGLFAYPSLIYLALS
jgi:hypothetical protein